MENIPELEGVVDGECMKVVICSLQYSPIYKSHCCALGNQLEKNGHEVKYLFNSNYKWMLSVKDIDKTTFIGNSRDVVSSAIDAFKVTNFMKIKSAILNEMPDSIYFYNIHPFYNLYAAKIARKHGLRFIQHIHEPYVEKKSVYGGAYQYMLYLFEQMQEKLLKNTDVAVLSSMEAMNLFNRRYPNFSGKKVMIRLMYEDIGKCPYTEHRRYITFIGPPVAAKNPERFLDIVDYSEKKDLGFEFLLISRFPVDNPKYKNHKNLKIYYKDKISDEEIGMKFKESIITITPYKTARQSSVVLTSYMYGTPVLSTNIGGLKESITHKETGYLLDVDSSVEEWIEGINFIKKNFKEMSVNCRKYFTDNFSETNWPKYFDEIFVSSEKPKKLILEMGCGD